MATAAFPVTINGQTMPNSVALPSDLPGLHSTDREERIAARRKRIAERLAARRAGEGAGEGEAGEEEVQVEKGKQQVMDSRKRLNKTKALGDERVTAVRVSADTREAERRTAEEARRQELRGKLLREAESSARNNAVIAMRWADLFAINVPQDLHAEIMKQKAACDRIIASKDKLVAEIKAELKLKDDDYVRSLRKQAEEVDQLIQLMGEQFREMSESYGAEMADVEVAFKQERNDLLAANRAEIAALFERRSAREQQFMEQTQERAEEFHLQLEELRLADAEEYNILKIRLETDIQNLEQHLEAMRATYQLNTEKLEYNHRVLQERDKENELTQQQQKRKIARHRDVLSNLKSRYHELDRKFQEENRTLTDEYRRVTEQFKDLQGKYRHFAKADSARRASVREMNADRAAALVQKVLQADKAIHDQLLGWAWAPPDADAFAAAETLDETEAAEREAAAAEQVDEQLRTLRAHPVFAPMLSLLAEEAGFLADAAALRELARLNDEDAVASTLLKASKNEVKSDAVLRALNISTARRFCALAASLTDSDEAHKLLVRHMDAAELCAALEDTSALQLCAPDEVAARLTAFAEASRAGEPDAMPSGTSAEASDEAGGGRAGTSQGGGGGGHKRAEERERAFWHKAVSVVSPMGFRVWKALEEGLKRYLGILQKRRDTLDELYGLQTQNEELRLLLNQYLASRINEELRVPPTAVI